MFGWPYLRFPTNTHYPNGKLPNIITHNGSRVTYWRLPTYFQWKTFFVTKFESNEGKCTSVQLQVNCQLQNYKKKSSQFWWLFFIWRFTQFGFLLSPIALMVVGPLLLDSNSSRDDTNPPLQFPIWQLTSKETKRQEITKKKMKWKLNQ